MTTTSQTSPPTTPHDDILKPAFGFVAEEYVFLERASEAKRQAELSREFSALWFANRYISDDATSEDIDYAADRYRRDAAGHAYAKAVHDVELSKIRKAV